MGAIDTIKETPVQYNANQCKSAANLLQRGCNARLTFACDVQQWQYYANPFLYRSYRPHAVKLGKKKEFTWNFFFAFGRYVLTCTNVLPFLLAI